MFSLLGHSPGMSVALLTNEEISYYTEKSTGADQISLKRKSDVPTHMMMTRAKRQKVSDKVQPQYPTRASKRQKITKTTVPNKPALASNVPNGKKTSKKTKPKKIKIPHNAIALLDYSIGEIVWCKLKGWPHWPCKILDIEYKRSVIYLVYWFKDNHRTSKVFKSQLFKFKENFKTLSENGSENAQLEAAIKEGIIKFNEKNQV